MTAEPHATVPCLTLALRGTPAVVREVRRNVRTFAAEHGAEVDALTRIELAVSEAAANAVVHGCPDGEGGIRVEADIEEGELEVVVLDEGPGFEDASGPGLGLGLALMRRGAAAFEIRDRPEGGVEVWMRFALET